MGICPIDLGHAPFGVIVRPLCSTSHGLSNKEKRKVYTIASFLSLIHI